METVTDELSPEHVARAEAFLAHWKAHDPFMRKMVAEYERSLRLDPTGDVATHPNPNHRRTS